ncbi:MAG: hypothetical protein VB853_00060, partial [Pirellulales bacterium]
MEQHGIALPYVAETIGGPRPNGILRLADTNTLNLPKSRRRWHLSHGHTVTQPVALSCPDEQKQ